MMTTFVYSLEAAPDEPAAIGGKGAGLSRLVQYGVPVPPGFALTADAFRLFIGANRLEDDLAAGGEGDNALDRLRACRWPEELRSAVEAAYASLCDRTGHAPVAVRSSATAEDGGSASFAGQHATLLNIAGFDAVLDATLQCWASLYRSEALHYRRTQGVQDRRPAMAVVVQALVPSEASGVAFTLDPVSGDRDLVLIEATWGLGEGVVSGIVTPDHFAVRKADGVIVRREVATKRVQVIAKSGGGTETEELSSARARQPALSDDRAVELARLAARIEEQAGAPQDIEWALAEGRLFILQARPVTAAGAMPVPPPEQDWVSEFDTETSPDTIWTAANVQEVLPGQLSPFNCSINADMMEQYGAEPVERVGIRLTTEDPFFGFFYGRPFLNVTMMLEAVDQMPFGSPEAMMDQYFGVGRNAADGLAGVDLNVVPKQPFFKKLLAYARVTPRALWHTRRMPVEIRRAERTIAEFDEEDAARPFSDMTDDELARVYDDGLMRGANVGITHVSGGGVTSSSFEWLRRCTERWLGDETGALQATLCTGLAGVESAQPAYELWEISRLVLASDRLREAFDSRDGAEIERRVNALPNDETRAFRRQLKAFLVHHGHRSVMEAEPAAKAWEEDPATVFSMLRNYLRADPAHAPQRIEERQRREREAATRDALRRLRWWQRPIFRYVLGEAQRWIVSREHTKSLLVRVTNRGRRLTRELARRMVERKLLAGVWDFYQLTWSEAKALLRGELTSEAAAAAIRRRREEDERNRQVTLPETFQGRPRPLAPGDVAPPDSHVLHGIPVSPGRVTGPARVILDPRRDATIEPGEILVAPVTDAGWTPLFVAAAGIVVDVGGTLSHGSTVAREYGLPAVVNVKHGTQMIRTGQTITVDGTGGIVVLEQE